MDTLNNKLIKEASQSMARTRPLKKLLSEGAQINYQTTAGYTALMFLALNKQDRAVEYLLKQGANPLLLNKDNKIASELISIDATIYPVLKDYELLFATMNNDLPMITTLVNNGAMINFQGSGGSSPLMIAVQQNQFAIVEYLLLQGANLFLTCAQGKNVFDIVSAPTIKQLLNDIRNIDTESEKTQLMNKYRSKKSHGFFPIPKPQHTEKVHSMN